MLLLFLEALFGETDIPLFFARRFDNIFGYFDALHDRRQETVHRFDQQIDQWPALPAGQQQPTGLYLEGRQQATTGAVSLVENSGEPFFKFL